MRARLKSLLQGCAGRPPVGTRTRPRRLVLSQPKGGRPALAPKGRPGSHTCQASFARDATSPLKAGNQLYLDRQNLGRLDDTRPNSRGFYLFTQLKIVFQPGKNIFALGKIKFQPGKKNFGRGKNKICPGQSECAIPGKAGFPHLLIRFPRDHPGGRYPTTACIPHRIAPRASY